MEYQVRYQYFNHVGMTKKLMRTFELVHLNTGYLEVEEPGQVKINSKT